MDDSLVFTQKQKEFLKVAQQNELGKINILEGCVRSGKTYISIPAWIMAISRTPMSAKYIIAGKTLGSIETNILPVIDDIAPGSVKHTRKNNYATIFGREVILKGVYDRKAEDGIRGATFAVAYCDEVTLYNQEFFDMLVTRLTLPNSLLIGTTNPDIPTHWLMQNYIKRAEETETKTWKFLLDDNTALPESTREGLKKTFVGVFYERNILGNWVAAEGVIYTAFANNREKYIVDKIKPYDLQSIHIGIDYGASKSKTAFIAIGFTHGFREMYILKEKTSLGIKTPEDMYESFFNFYEELEEEYGRNAMCYADWGGLGQVLTKGIQNYFFKRGKPIRIQDCFKVRIIERINMTCRLMGAERFKIHKDCKETIEALSSAVWEDGKDDTRLDNGSVNIDVLDAMEYAFSNYMQSLNNSFNFGVGT